MPTQALEQAQIHNLQAFVADKHEDMMKRVELIMSITAKSHECTSLEQYVLLTLGEINKIYGVITDDNLFSVLDELDKYQLIPETLNPWDDRDLYDPNACFVQEAFYKSLATLREEGKIARSDDVYMGFVLP